LENWKIDFDNFELLRMNLKKSKLVWEMSRRFSWSRYQGDLFLFSYLFSSLLLIVKRLSCFCLTLINVKNKLNKLNYLL